MNPTKKQLKAINEMNKEFLEIQNQINQLKKLEKLEKRLKEIQEVEKKVAQVCDDNDSIIDEITGIAYPKKTTEVTINDKGVIVNKETGNPHFEKSHIDILNQIMPPKKSRDVSVSLTFGKRQPYLTLEEQIEQQGFNLPLGFITDSEKIRNELHGLNEAGILNSKQLLKCFKKLSIVISKKVIDSELKDGELAVHKKTIQN